MSTDTNYAVRRPYSQHKTRNCTMIWQTIEVREVAFLVLFVCMRL